MTRRKRLIPIAVVVLTVLQGFALPSSRGHFYPQVWDDEEDTCFTKWSADSLRIYIDSVLGLVPIDSVEMEFVMLDTPDSFQSIFDSVKRAMFLRDSTEKARIAFQKWFDSLPKKEQKKWTMENVIFPAQKRKLDSLMAVKDSIKAVKDSITENTPRILETPFIPDSMYYKRLLLMHQDLKFGDISFARYDTSYNYHYYDYPLFHQDVNATWLGTAGTPVQLYNVYKRTEEENAIFFTPYQSWTYTPSTVPMYNTKTPYTELAYWGTLFSGQTKEEINVHFLTTQNILPSLNIAFEVNKFGGQGMIQNEKTDASHMTLTANYLGKKYQAHGGWIHSNISRTESGGIKDCSMITDTSLVSRELSVYLKSASNAIKRNTLFLNHNLRIPFGNDSLTTAFVGHSLDWSTYTKNYADKINDADGKAFYHNTFLITPGSSADTMKVSKLDNKLYLRLQPWKDGSIVSKIDVGIGDKLLTYHDFHHETDTSGVSHTSSGKNRINTVYAYAGARGMFKKYLNWNADGKIHFAGYQAGDFEVNANLTASIYPFRRSKDSPLSFNVNFHTDLSKPDHYENRIVANHYRWDNNFERKSTMKVGGAIDIPYWKLHLDAGYTLLGNAIYYGADGVIRQNPGTVSVISANLQKEFVLWKFHLDNNLLFQYSSDNNVVPVPMFAMNLRYYFQFNVVKNVMQMQIGAQCLFNTLWQMPAFNPNLGVFYNQTGEKFGMSPYIDVFVNVQWKRACIFLKGENINEGWPAKRKDYFTARGYIHTQRMFKVGIFWPFYIQPARLHKHIGEEDGHSHGGAIRNSGLKKG